MITTFARRYAAIKWIALLAMILVQAACRPSSLAFKIAAIVDATTDPVSRAEVEGVLEDAEPRFLELTGYRLETIAIAEDNGGGSMESIATRYMAQASEIPNGILIFSVGDDDRAVVHRAYSGRMPGPVGFRNAFVSPIPGVDDSHVYFAVVQFNHLYAA